MNDEEYGSDSYLFYGESGILFESDRWKYISSYEIERMAENNDLAFIARTYVDLSKTDSPN